MAVHLDGGDDGTLECPVVVRVDEYGVRQLVGSSGELGEHEHPVAVDVRRRVLLGDEVHAVTERCHQHHVAGAVQRDQLVERQRLVQVVHDRQPDAAVAAVDGTDEAFDLVALVLVVLDRLSGGRGDLHHHVALRVEFARFEERGERLEPQTDALGVVEAVDAEQDHLRVAEAGADLAHPLARRSAGGHLLDVAHVDRDRERADVGQAIGMLDGVIVGVDAVSSCAAAAKFAASFGRWKPTRSQPSSPSTTSVRHGNRENSS